MDLNGYHRKWPTAGRRWQHLERILILFASMSAFSLMMIINMDVYRYNSGGNTVVWAGDSNNLEQNNDNDLKLPDIRQMAMPAMKTIVAYSPEKQAEMDRKYPIFCKTQPEEPEHIKKEERWLDVQNTGVSLYAAYYDARVPHQPYTRILAIANGSFFDQSTTLFCQTWKKFGDEEVLEVIEATVTQIWWSEWDPSTTNTVTPILISCALMSSRQETYNTTVTIKPCESSTTVLSVKPSYDNKHDRNFTVCVKDMNFINDISDRLVEWFELLKILGAEYFHIYVAKVPRNVHNVLEYYSRHGVASIHKAPRPTAAFLWQRRRDHLIAYNDCLYRNLIKSRYIIPLDVDEIIVPKKSQTWNEMLQILQPLENEAPGAASLAVSNAFFFDSFNMELNEYQNIFRHSLNNVTFGENLGKSHKIPHTLRHLRRSSLVSPAPDYSKSFVSTTRALTVFNHYALAALSGAERARAVPEEIALLHHYKSSCQPDLVDCRLYTESSVRDESLLRVSSDLINNINKVLKGI